LLVLEFPMLADYGVLYERGRMIFLTHGHVFHEGNLPMLGKGDILLHGHTHVPVCREHEDYIYMNPGSVAIPKEDSEHSYMSYEDGLFLWKNLE
ncbi:MAG: metallophosphoesterase family protein, partial [Lachnospiraceae bacterium]|nr:metallophosphoesterase family protein [Lachnospiraceae bacterium]